MTSTAPQRNGQNLCKYIDGQERHQFQIKLVTTIYLAFVLVTYGNFGEYVEKERDDRVVDPYSLSAKSLPEVLRHGVHSRGHVDGDEKPAQHQDR